jgi:hypothetical protein
MARQPASCGADKVACVIERVNETTVGESPKASRQRGIFVEVGHDVIHRERTCP